MYRSYSILNLNVYFSGGVFLPGHMKPQHRYYNNKTSAALDGFPVISNTYVKKGQEAAQ